MPDSMPPEPPTYFANIATVHVTVDEVSIEFRRVMKPHAELWKLHQEKVIPPMTEEEMYRVAPEAKVVLTFVGAKALAENLNKLLPGFENVRKQG